MQLSASIYSKNKIDIISSLAELEKYNVDLIHIDCNNDSSVFEDIHKITDLCTFPIDLHVVSDTPEIFYKAIQISKIDRVSFQVENLSLDFVMPKFEGKKIGLAIQIENPFIFELINKYVADIDFILLMTTTPGKSGGKFNKESFKIIRDIISNFSNIHFCVDGGVNHEIAYILRLLGVNSIVIGSYLMNHQNMAAAILSLKSRMVQSNFSVSDFMTPINKLPIIDIDSDNFISMLKQMEKYKLGIVFCINKEGILKGIITNADIRKKLLTEEFTYDISLKEITNFYPKKITKNYNTTEMLEFISKINFPILVLPIIDENDGLAGAISFHSLIKGD